MSKSIKLKDNTYLDSSSITHRRKSASNLLDKLEGNHFFEMQRTLPNFDMWWRVLRLPFEFCGFIMVVTPNYSGVMTTTMFKVAYAYGSPVFETFASSAFASHIFKSARICYTQGGYGYLELQANGILNDNSYIKITCIGSHIGSEFEVINEIGDDTSYSVINTII